MSGATVSTVLEGDLGHFFLSEVLQFLQLANVTGMLAIERAGERAEIAFDRGSPIGASTSRGSVR